MNGKKGPMVEAASVADHAPKRAVRMGVDVLDVANLRERIRDTIGPVKATLKRLLDDPTAPDSAIELECKMFAQLCADQRKLQGIVKAVQSMERNYGVRG